MSRVIINYAQSFYCYYYIDEKKGEESIARYTKIFEENRCHRLSQYLKNAI